MIGDFPEDDSIDIDRVLRGERQTDRPKPRTIAEVVSLRPKLNGGPKQSHKILASLDFPDITATGIIRPTCANTRIAIGKLEVVCEYDEFHDKLLIGGQPIGQYAGELSDHACVYLRKMIDEQFGFDPGRNAMHDACVQLCLENRFDPIVDYLNSLEWDGIERIDEWLSTYLGAKDTDLNRAIGRIALIAQVRRAKSPGCKFDQIIVLESPEGKDKSTALSILSGGPENFSDQTILGQRDRDQQEALRGVWVYEIADLSNIRKAEVEDVKAFASRTHDRARPAYGRFRVDLPRRGVIWATTNNSEYLKSQTGNRRFWPIEVAATKPIDIEGLTRDRDQLLAEACHLRWKALRSCCPENYGRRQVKSRSSVVRLIHGRTSCARSRASFMRDEERILSKRSFR